MKNFDYAEVTRLLDEMEKCVDRVRALRVKFEHGCFDDEHPDF